MVRHQRGWVWYFQTQQGTDCYRNCQRLQQQEPVHRKHPVLVQNSIQTVHQERVREIQNQKILQLWLQAVWFLQSLCFLDCNLQTSILRTTSVRTAASQ
jgi:hypothetical protein